MHNRPLCMVTAAYCTGIFLFFYAHDRFLCVWKHDLKFIYVCAAIGIVYIILMLLYLKFKNICCRLRRIFVYLTAVFFVVGAYNAAQKEHFLEKNIPKDGSDIYLSGSIYKFEKKENSYAVYLKNCVYSYDDLNSDNLLADSRSRLRCLIYIKDVEDVVACDLDEDSDTKLSSKSDTKLSSLSGEKTYIDSDGSLSIGSVITVRGSVSAFSSPSNRGQFDEKAYYWGSDIHFRMFAEQVLSYIRHDNSILQKFYDVRVYFDEKLSKITDEKTAGIYQAMILGEKGNVDSETKDIFMKGSIGHILVVSGLHFSVIGMAVYKLLRKKSGFIVSGTVSCAVLFLFGILSGFSTSSIRAFVMFAIFMCANMWGPDYDMLTSLSFAVLVILIINPYAMFLSGFVLSVSAILGIIVVVPFLDNIFNCKSKIVKAITASLGIQIFTIPVTLYYFYYFNPYSMLINAVVLPFMSFILIDGVGAAVLSLVNISAAGILILPGKYILKGIVQLCVVMSDIPFASVYPKRPSAVTCVLYYILLSVVLFTIRKYNESRRKSKVFKLFNLHKVFENLKVSGITELSETSKTPEISKTLKILEIFVLLSLSCVFFIHRRYPLKITMLDVGQGQCMYIETGSGLKMLYDGGSTDVSEVGKYRIISFLKAEGCVVLDAVFVSHLDEDHVSGIMEIIMDKDVEVKQIFLPDTSFKDDKYMEIKSLAGTEGIMVNVFGNGSLIENGGIKIRGIHPSPDFQTTERNDTSIVFELNYKQFKMLFCGDMEEEAMNYILSQDVLEDTDILQVAHHGSSYTTSERFLEIVSPEISLISCGENNRYNHPHEQLLKRLENSGSRIFVTKDCGEIDIKVRGDKYVVNGFKHD